MSRVNLNPFITRLRTSFLTALDGKQQHELKDVELAFEKSVLHAVLGGDEPAQPAAKASGKVPAGSKAAKDRAAKASATRAKNKAAQQQNLANIADAAKQDATGAGGVA